MRKYLWILGLCLLSSCGITPIQPDPIVFQPGPVVVVVPQPVSDPSKPISEEQFQGIVGLTTQQLLVKIGQPWRVVPGNTSADPEAWHYRVKRSEDGTSSDAEVLIKAGKVVDANVDF